MNIFMIPTWYPQEEIPHSGIFCKEQALAVLDNFKEYKYFVSIWGQDTLNLDIKKPLEFFNKIKKLKKDRIIETNKNLFEVHTPCLYPNFKLGGLKVILNSCEKGLKKVLESEKIDVIHAHVGYPAGFIAYTLSKKYNIPYVLTEHMGPFPFKHLLKNRKLIKELDLGLKNASKLIAVSNSLRKDMQSYLSETEISVVSNVVDTDKFIPANSSEEKEYFFTLCGLNEHKGLFTLLEGVKLYTKKKKGKFVIAGDGPLKEDLINYAKKLEIDDYIEWVGNIDRNTAVRYYQNAKAFVLPSDSETFGIVYIESMSCGVPVIATKCGGPEEFVDESNGILINKKNPEELSQALIDIELKEYNFKEIRQNIIEKYSRKSFADKMTKIYNEVLS